MLDLGKSYIEVIHKTINLKPRFLNGYHLPYFALNNCISTFYIFLNYLKVCCRHHAYVYSLLANTCSCIMVVFVYLLNYTILYFYNGFNSII